jgi:signal peptidase II
MSTETSKPNWFLFVGTAVGVLILDLWSKWLAFTPGTLSFVERLEVIPGVLAFRLVYNEGALWGIGQGHSWFFLLLSVIAVPVLVWLFLKGFRRHWWPSLAIGCIMAGALGNMYDRYVFEKVRDFLEFTFIDFPVFNVADSGICVGVTMLMIELIFFAEKEEQTTPESPQDVTTDTTEEPA